MTGNRITIGLCGAEVQIAIQEYLDRRYRAGCIPQVTSVSHRKPDLSCGLDVDADVPEKATGWEIDARQRDQEA